MQKQENLIDKRNWDCLIVLDACRYDYFENVYEDYLGGDLEKVLSSGSSTEEWLKGTFEGKNFFDTVYISSNAFVNSKGITAGEGFDATDCFFKIIDLWDEGWDEKKGTVPPKKVSKTTRMIRAKHPKKKLISHFMQPHYPYLPLKNIPRESKKQGFRGQVKEGEGFSTFEKLRRFLGKTAIKILGHEWGNKITRLKHKNKPGVLKKVEKKIRGRRFKGSI